MSEPRPICLIARRIPAAGGDRIAERCEVREGGPAATPDLLRELAPGAAAIVTDPTVAVGPELLDAAGPGLRLVANFAVGYDNIDLDACRERGVIATNTPDVLTDATAELALALTLAAARGLPAAERRLRDGEWKGFDTTGDLGTGLSGATFGIVGMGRIGRRYAELVRPLAGSILYTARNPKPEAEAALGAELADLAQLLSGADVVSVHAAATPETTGMIGAPRARIDATRSDPRQHRPGLAGRLGGTCRGPRRRHDRGRRTRRLRERAGRGPASCSRPRTASSSPTSARRRPAPGTRWRAWSPTRWSPSSTAASRRTGWSEAYGFMWLWTAASIVRCWASAGRPRRRRRPFRSPASGARR